MMMSPPRIQAPRSLFLKEISVSMTAATRGLVGSEFSWGRNLGCTHAQNIQVGQSVNQFHPLSYLWLRHTHNEASVPGDTEVSLFTCTHFLRRTLCTDVCSQWKLSKALKFLRTASLLTHASAKFTFLPLCPAQHQWLSASSPRPPRLTLPLKCLELCAFHYRHIAFQHLVQCVRNFFS